MFEHEPDGDGGDEPADVVDGGERKTELRERHDEEIPRKKVPFVFHATDEFGERAVANGKPSLRFVFPVFVEVDGDEGDEEVDYKGNKNRAVGF